MGDVSYEVLREVYRIVEYRDGCVYRTEYVETRWVPMDQLPPPGFQHCPVSDPDVQTIRRRREDA